MELEWLVTDVTAVRAPERAGPAVLRVILAGRFFGQFRPNFVVGEPFCDAETPS